jgi:DNA-binding CsgD family transcriptional regulator
MGDLGSLSTRRVVKLSRKERAVLAGLAAGHTTEAIAAGMCVSPHTIRTHVKNAMRKMGARTRAHAVAIAMCEGAIEVERAPRLALPAA